LALRSGAWASQRQPEGRLPQCRVWLDPSTLRSPRHGLPPAGREPHQWARPTLTWRRLFRGLTLPLQGREGRSPVRRMRLSVARANVDRTPRRAARVRISAGVGPRPLRDGSLLTHRRSWKLARGLGSKLTSNPRGPSIAVLPPLLAITSPHAVKLTS
jgi:hypothetical protein